MWFTFKVSMFFTSFFPLWLGIIIFNLYDVIEFYLANDFNMRYSPSLILPLVSIITISITLFFTAAYATGVIKKHLKRKNNQRYKVSSIIKSSKILSEFIAAYTLPLIAFDFSSLKDIILFLVYFTTIAFLCMRYDYIYTNILLEMLGYKLYVCTVTQTHNQEEIPIPNCLVISKTKISDDDELVMWDFSTHHYLNVGS